MDTQVKIECPKCSWEPGPDSLWGCTCGHAWNTFDTAGRCPNCGKQWEHTQCHGPWAGGCAQWSPHLDWYKGLDDAVREALQEAMKKAREETPM